MNKIPRRRFLRNGSVLIALPFIEELVGIKSYADGLKKYNYLTCFHGLGCPMELIKEDFTGPLSNFAPFKGTKTKKSKLTVLHKIKMPPYASLSLANSVHPSSNAQLVCGSMAPDLDRANRGAGGNRSGDMTLDYRLYQLKKYPTPIDIFAIGSAIGRTALVTQTRSWRSQTNFERPIFNPKLAFIKLFGNAGKDGKGAEKLVVDVVIQEFKSLMGDRQGLSNTAKTKIQETVDEIHEINKTLALTDAPTEFAIWANNLKNQKRWTMSIPDYDSLSTTNPKPYYDEKIREWVHNTYAELIVLGLRLNIFNYGSYMTNGGGEFPGNIENYGNEHQIQHSYGNSRKDQSSKKFQDAYTKVESFVTNHYSHFARLAGLLDKVPWGDSNETLLDYTTLFVATPISHHHHWSDITMNIIGGPFKHKNFIDLDNKYFDTELYNTIYHAHCLKTDPSKIKSPSMYFGDKRGWDQGLISDILPA